MCANKMPATFPFLFTMQLLSSSLHCSTVGGRGRKGGRKKGVTPGVSLDTQLCAPPPPPERRFPKSLFFFPPPPSAAAVVGSLVKSENSFSEKPKKKKKKEPVIIIKKKILTAHVGFLHFRSKKKGESTLISIRSGARCESGVRVVKSVGAKNGDPKERKLSLESRKKGKKGSWQEISDVLWVPNRRHHASSFPESNKRKQQQTKFDDLRRGNTEDFQRLTKFKGLCKK